jgi:hypothetical protein
MASVREESLRWVRRKRIFYLILVVYAALSVLWISIDLLTGDGLWFYWPMLGVGLFVVVTGIVLFGLGGLFGQDWERRQVDRYIERRGHSGPDQDTPA